MQRLLRLRTKLRNRIKKLRHRRPRPVILHPDGMECPHCHVWDEIAQVERALRYHRGELIVEDGQTVIRWFEDDETEFNFAYFDCSNCFWKVTIPGIDSIKQEWV